MSTSLRTALDIGTSQIRLAVVQVDQKGTSTLLAYGIHDNFGLKNGIIENSEEVRERVLECISKVEDFYKIKISDVASSLPGITENGSTNVAGFEKLASTLNNSKTKLSKVFLKNHVAADSVLTAQEKNSGVLVIDIGAGTSSYSFYNNGNLIKFLTLPIAGDSITSDLAFALRAPGSIAEKIKIDLSTVLDLNKYEFKVPSFNGGADRKIRAITVLEIIEPRIIEIFELISHAKKELGSIGEQIKSIVLTGGTSLTPSISKISSEVFGLSTRIGYPVWGVSAPDKFINPRASVLAGIIKSYL